MNEKLEMLTALYALITAILSVLFAAVAATFLVDAILIKGLISNYGKWGAGFALAALYFWYQFLLCDEAL